MYSYRFDQDYEANYLQGPVSQPVPHETPGTADRHLFGRPVRTPVGIFSGPLLNSRWVEYYAMRGFDVLVYKTVRSHACSSHPLPNCAYLPEHDPLPLYAADRPRFLRGETQWPAPVERMSMTNSFGMPSRPPDVWQADVSQALSTLRTDQVLMVSVVGDDVADYATTARLAREAGAHAVELNLSCPNVLGKEGSLFLDAEATATVCQAVASALGETPLVVKLGYIEEDDRLDALLTGVRPYVAGVSGINTVPMEVRDRFGQPLLGPERRRAGVCGHLIKPCGLAFASRVAAWRQAHEATFALLAGGGIMQPSDIDEYLAAGADVAMVATGAMIHPDLASRYRQPLSVKS